MRPLLSFTGDSHTMISITADNLPRVMGCNGVLNMEPAHPPLEGKDNTIRDEGTAAHYMAQAVHAGQFLIEELIDRQAPNGVYMDADMSRHVEAYLDQGFKEADLEVETNFHGDGWEVRGRADRVFYNRDSLIIDEETGEVLLEPDTLLIDDLKYGYTLIEPDENWTLIAHAIGTCIKRQISPSRICLRILQPRAYHPDGKVRSWWLTYEQLMGYYKRISDTLYRPDGLLHTGPWCYKCTSRAVCPADRQAANISHDVTQRAFMDDLPDADLACELDLIRASMHTLKNRTQALEELALHRLNQGRVVGDYVREQGYGHRRWNTGLDAATLKVLTGVDLSTEPGTVTPAEAERRGVSETVVSALAHAPKTSVKLVKESANRRAKRHLKKETP